MMNIVKFALLAALMTLSFSQTPAEKAANIGYLASGYNVYLGDPLASFIDPGFSISPVFNLTYLQNQTSPDGKYLVPDLVTILSEDSCVLNSAATAISGANSYLKSLDVFASVDGGCPFGGFSASANYKTVSQSTSTNNEFYTLSNGQCTVYDATITLMDLPQFDDLFIQNVVDYLETSDSDMHYEFLSGYGTHYVQQITMGSRLSVMSQLTQNSWETLESQGITVTAAAQVSFMGFYAGFSTNVSSVSQSMTSFESSSSTFKITTIGSVPPSGGNSIEWADQAVTNPMPVVYTVTSFTNLFNSVPFTSAVEAISSSVNLTKIQDNLNAALQGGYCQYLLSQGTVSTCSALNPDAPLPVTKGSCVLCASGCGGDYTQVQGIFDTTMVQPSWFYDYVEGCAETTILSHNTFNYGVDLCCLPEIPNEVNGTCRMCQGCGGTFSNRVGSLWDGSGNINGWLQSYGPNCEGNLDGGSDDGAGYDLCCDASDVCAFCLSCGGEYAYENGVIGSGSSSSDKSFSFLGDNCSGSFGWKQSSQSQGLKLCCAQ